MKTKHMEIRKNPSSSHSMKSRTGKDLLIYYGSYTLLFLLLFYVCFYSFFINGKSFIYAGDGIKQHYNALVYYGDWLRQIVATHQQTGNWVIPQWDLNLGFGMDIITTLHYYVIGEPLNVLSYFVSPENTEYLFDVIVVLRFYLAGIAFSIFSLYCGRKKEASLVGSLMYVFCGYAVHAALRHPFFITPMIWFPLILTGVEMIERKGNPLLFMLSVCGASLSNFYFLYMVVIGVILYVCLRFFSHKHKHPLADFLSALIRYAIYGFVGILMSMSTLLPLLIAFLKSGRSGAKQTLMAFYSKDYYESFLSLYFHADSVANWTIIGIAVPAMLTLFILFSKKKKYFALKAAFVILTLCMLMPFAGYTFNGFSYVSNRWSFLYITLIIYIFTILWDDLCQLDQRALIFSMVGSILCIALVMIFENGKSENVFCSLMLMALLLCLLLAIPRLAKAEYRNTFTLLAVLLITLVNLAANSHYWFDYKERNIISSMVDSGKAYESILNSGAKAVSNLMQDQAQILDTDTYQIMDLAKYQALQEALENGPDAENTEEKKKPVSTSPYRFEQDEHTVINAADLLGLPGTSFFWSLANTNTTDHFSDLGLNYYLLSYVTNLNSRLGMDALASVKYYVKTQDSSPLMYGYEKVGEICANPEAASALLKDYKKEMKLDSTQKKLIQKKYDKEAYETSLPEDETEKEEYLEKEAEKEEEFHQLMNSTRNYIASYPIYQNKNTLPLGYSYKNYILRSDFDQLSLSQKEQTLLENVLIENEQKDLLTTVTKVKTPEFTEKELEYSMEADNGVRILKDGSIYVEKKNGKVNLQILQPDPVVVPEDSSSAAGKKTGNPSAKSSMENATSGDGDGTEDSTDSGDIISGEEIMTADGSLENSPAFTEAGNATGSGEGTESLIDDNSNVGSGDGLADVTRDNSIPAEEEVPKVSVKDTNLSIQITCSNVEPLSQYQMTQDKNAVDYSQTLYQQMSKLDQNNLKKQEKYWNNQWDHLEFPITAKAGNVSSDVTYTSEYFQWQMPQQDYILNLGYQKKDLDQVSLIFSEPGIYHLDNLKLLSQPVEGYEDKIKALKVSKLTNISRDTNTVEGDFTSKSDKVLCLSLPYDEGWSLTVDGKETEILKTNGMYMGVSLKKGNHHIVFTYATPGLEAGRRLSVLGFIVMVLLTGFSIFIHHMSRKKRRRRKHHATSSAPSNASIE